MKKTILSLATLMCFFAAALLTSCGEVGKSYEGPLGNESTVAAKYISQLQEMNAKMKTFTSPDQFNDAMNLQNQINALVDEADNELKSFKTRNPNGKQIPFEQKRAKDIYKISVINFVGYNLNSRKEDVQAHFQAKIKVLNLNIPDGISADFVDAAGNILSKEKFYLGIGVSEKPEINKVIPLYCNINEFSKILGAAKIVVE